jgi:hypothetical protein
MFFSDKWLMAPGSAEQALCSPSGPASVSGALALVDIACVLRPSMKQV